MLGQRPKNERRHRRDRLAHTSRVPDPRAFALHKAWSPIAGPRSEEENHATSRRPAPSRARAEYMPHLPFSEAIRSLHGGCGVLITRCNDELRFRIKVPILQRIPPPRRLVEQQVARSSCRPSPFQ